MSDQELIHLVMQEADSQEANTIEDCSPAELDAYINQLEG